jgi:hypothetical protein
MGLSRWRWLTLFLAVTSGGAVAADYTVVPGLMGYNALPAPSNLDPAIGRDIEVELSMVAQASDLAIARDRSVLPHFRVTVPFRQVAALDIDGIPLEWWRIGSDSQQRLGATRPRGETPGDLYIGARFQFLGEGKWRPATGLRLLMKTASGEYDERRFTDAPAYAFEGLVGKDLHRGPGLARLRVYGKLGFFSWQQGDAWQNDAVDFGATVEARLRRGASLSAEWRGYSGYQERDKPQVLGLTVGVPMRQVELRAGMARGLTSDAPPYEARVGVVLRFEVPALNE